MISKKDDLNGRKPQWKMVLMENSSAPGISEMLGILDKISHILVVFFYHEFTHKQSTLSLI